MEEDKKTGIKGFLSIGDLGAIRTPDPQLRRLLLYPAELRDHVLYYIRKSQIGQGFIIVLCPCSV